MKAAAIARYRKRIARNIGLSGWAILDVIANIDDLNQVDIKNAETHQDTPARLYNEKYTVMKIKHNSIATYELRTYKRNADATRSSDGRNNN